MTVSSSTFKTDTELSAVNQVLGAIGQAPITTLDYANPEISYIYQLLQECNRDVQSEGWSFNTETHVTKTPDANNQILVTDDVLQVDMSGDFRNRNVNVIVKDSKLYDKVQHTNEFTKAKGLLNNDGTIDLDYVYLLEFTNLPQPFKRLVIYRAASRAAAQLVSNPQLVQMLQQNEVRAQAYCMEYECNQGDYSMMGWRDGTVWDSYSPSSALQR
jgi:hypothetical protein|tara:strand:+ start:798 stop:1442 length:645 start_codon:yes stop_codon:yes gene_type:complete